MAEGDAGRVKLSTHTRTYTHHQQRGQYNIASLYKLSIVSIDTVAQRRRGQGQQQNIAAIEREERAREKTGTGHCCSETEQHFYVLIGNTAAPITPARVAALNACSGDFIWPILQVKPLGDAEGWSCRYGS